MSDSVAGDALKQRVVALVRDWYATESGGRGIANTGLRMLEILRDGWPLEEETYLSQGGSQVSGLNGASGNAIIARYDASLARLGTESGRTSRGTPKAAKRLADALNALAPLGSASDAERSDIVDAAQRWIVDEPIKELFSRERLRFAYRPDSTLVSTIGAMLRVAEERKQSGCVAQHLVGAKLQLRFPDISVPAHGCTTADAQTGRSGDFQLGTTVIHVTVAPGSLVVEKCRQNIADGTRPVLLVPAGRQAGALANVAEGGLEDQVAVYSIEYFIAQNLEEISVFDGGNYRSGLKRLLDEYNRRIDSAEVDKSIMFRLPANI